MVENGALLEAYTYSYNETKPKNNKAPFKKGYKRQLEESVANEDSQPIKKMRRRSLELVAVQDEQGNNAGENEEDLEFKEIAESGANDNNQILEQSLQDPDPDEIDW